MRETWIIQQNLHMECMWNGKIAECKKYGWMDFD